MLIRSGKNWVVDLFLRRGWLVKGRRVRRREGNWNRLAIVAAECQCLEQRILLSTITVTSAADSGNGTLRNAVASASTGDTIDFATAINGTPIALTSGQLTISHPVTITGNGAANTIIDAQHNSRIFNLTNTAGAVTFDSLTLENGKTTAQFDVGGAIYSSSINASSSLTVTNSTLSGNSTTGNDASGGAIWTFGGAVIVTNSTLSGNSTAGNDAGGGAIFSGGPVTVTNSTLSGNSTAGTNAYGGAIAAVGLAVTVTNSTISQNHATNAQGGGIYLRGLPRTTITLNNTILAQNTDNGTAPDLHPAVATLTITHSLIGDNTGTGLTAAPVGSPDANGNLIGTSLAKIDPKLGALANNGGSTQTMAELSGSPAIDAGSNALAIDPANENVALTTDQRGAPFNRIFNTTVDMGAYEYQTQALSLVVNSADDTLDAVYNPAHLTLRDAVALADGNVGIDTITFDPAINGTPIDLTLGQMVISDTVTITGNGAANTIINAQQNSRIFNITNTAGDVTLDGLTIENGKTIDKGSRAGGSGDGGAIRSLSAGTLTVTNSTLSGNSATGIISYGGAIFSNSALTVTNSTLSGNATTGLRDRGGAIFSNSALTVTNSTLSGNFTTGNSGLGGAIYSTGGLTVTNSTLSGNDTTGAGASGGAIAANNALTVTNSTLSGNSTAGDGSVGGAIFSTSLVTVTNSTLTGNSTAGSSSFGGAIGCLLGSIVVTNSTLSGNSTTGGRGFGGAICLYGGNSFAVTNSTLSGNSSSSFGGAIYSGALLTVTNSTIVQNHAPGATGGGIHTGAISPSLLNTILSQNTDSGTNPDLYAKNPGTMTITHSLIGDNTGTGLTAAPVGSPDANGNLIGTGGAKIDPLLGALANNSGPTQTMAELAGSPAIDAGSNALAIDPANENVALTTDQRGAGFARIVGTVDMGAYEVQSTGSAPSFTSAPNMIFAVGLFGTFTVTASGTPGATLSESNTDTLPAGVKFIAATGILSGTPGANTNGDYILHFTASNGVAPDATQTFTLKVTSQFPFAGEYAVNAGGPLTLASITQVGSALTLNGTSTTAPATITDATHILVNGTDTATYGNSSLVFTTGTFAGQTWTKLTLPTDFTNPAGAPVHAAQNGSSVTFTDKNGRQGAGTWVSPTQLSAYGETVTVSNGQLLWSSGIDWSQTLVLNGIENRSGPVSIVSVPNQIQVLNYVNGSGTHTYVISNGTNAVGLIDGQGTLQMATFFNNSQATDSNYPGDTITFTGSNILWQDGTVWTPTASAGPSPPVVTHFTNTAGVSTHVVRNGSSTVLFIDSIGTVSLGTFIDSTQVNDPRYSGDLASFVAGTVTWQDGIVWTPTANPPIKIVATDQNGVTSHLLVQTATTLIGLDGPLQSLIATRVNDEIEWSNGDVWSNFDYDLLNTLFEMGSGYP